ALPLARDGEGASRGQLEPGRLVRLDAPVRRRALGPERVPRVSCARDETRAGRRARPAASRLARRPLVVRPAPACSAPKLAAVDGPEFTLGPIEILADNLQEARGHVVDRGGLGEHTRDGELRLKTLLCLLTEGDVRDEGQSDECVAASQKGEADLDSKLAAVPPPAGEIEAQSHGTDARVGEEVGAMRGVRGTQSLRDQVLQRLSGHVASEVPEHLAEATIRPRDATGAVDGED